ncbi:MAG TPA: hypothetical protein VN838_07210, partial [Bradyrhizobium sp.]|nr:hypothetical protein [Bradyrhizobium sp.]
LPRLFDSTYRIRAYRHWRFHSELYQFVKDAIREYFIRDLGGEPQSPGAVEFQALQQIILDELLLSIQEELAALSD